MTTKHKLYFSHSAINTYKDCPRKYKLHYIDRIRPVWAPSYFLFGSAIDSATEYLMLNFKDFDKEKYIETFVNAMTNYDINKIAIDASNTTLIRFSNADCQIELLSSEVEEKIVERGSKLFDDFTIKTFIAHHKDLKRQQKADKKAGKEYVPIDKDIQLLYNNICYNCLLEKGRSWILPTFEKWAFENVQEVYGVQQKIEIVNNNKDVFTGYTDFDVTLKTGKRIICDFKTTSTLEKDYHDESANESVQLGVYSQELDNPNVAYIVFDKNIRKTDRTGPRLRWKFVEGTITEEHLDNVFSDIEESMTMLKEDNEFNRVTVDEGCFLMGGCKYFNYCNKNSNMDGLVNLNEKRDLEKR